MQTKPAFALTLIAALALSSSAAAGDPSAAALQVALRARGVYHGPIDGIAGPGTERAIRLLQHRAGLTVDGVLGPATRRALGRFARHRLGTRSLRPGESGWDVAELQYRLAEHGFTTGAIDGGFGPRTEQALRRFQRWAGLRPDGHAGAATEAALQQPAPRFPLPLRWPLRGRVAVPFGPGKARFHAALTLAARPGTAVAAAATGRVAAARDGRVVLIHGRGLRSVYADLIDVRVHTGELVAAGSTLALVGGEARLVFQLSARGAALDPLRALR